MSFEVSLDPPAVAVDRVELNLNEGPIQCDQKGIDWGDAAVNAFMAEQQRWGSTAVDFKVPNRIVTIPLFIGGGDDSGEFGTASEQLRQKVALFQREGGWLRRDSPYGTLYADVEGATLRFPDVWGTTAELEPDVTLTLECLPDFYGDPIALDPINGAGGVTVPTLYKDGEPAVIKGDHPARVEITVTDTSDHAQCGFIWGFWSRYRTEADSGNLLRLCPSAFLPPDVEFTLSPGAVFEDDAGAVDGRTAKQALYSIADGVAAAEWHDVVSFSGTHLGSYRLWARMKTDALGVYVRLGWVVGDGARTINDPVPFTVPTRRLGARGVPALAEADPDGYYLIDLGQIHIDPSISPQQWIGTVSGYLAEAPGGGDDYVPAYIDSVLLQPLDDSSGELVCDTVRPVIPENSFCLLRTNGMVRAAPGGFLTPVDQTYGDLPRLPVSGMEGRHVAALFKPSRGDLGSSADSLDDFTVDISYRPTYLFRP